MGTADDTAGHGTTGHDTADGTESRDASFGLTPMIQDMIQEGREH